MKVNGRALLLLATVIVGATRPVSAAQVDGQPTKDPPRATIELFNGRNLDGWEAFVSTGADPANSWKVEGGMIRGAGKPEGYLRTKTAYADYRLHLEWRWPDGDGKGNSGVILHIVNPDWLWPKGFEANLQSGRVGDLNVFVDARSKEEVLGRIPNRYATGRIPRPSADSVEKAVGEWNSFDIVADGDTITLTANGVQVNRITGVIPSGGMIGLQSEGAAVDFRNVTLTPLPPAKNMHVPMPTTLPRTQ